MVHHGFDKPLLQIIVHKLNGKNFLQWSQSVKLFIQGKGNIGFLTGANKAPKEDDPTFPVWNFENSMVMAWIINSMDSKIGRTNPFLPTTKEIFDSVEETYSDVGNFAQIFEIKTKLRELRQGGLTITHYNTMKTL